MHIFDMQIQTLCSTEVQTEERDSAGRVEECLKVALVDGRIMNRACKLEVAGLIEEAKADIHVDPLLHNACVTDIHKYCIDVPQGAGRSKESLQMYYEVSLGFTCRTRVGNCPGALAEEKSLRKWMEKEGG